MAIEPFEVEFPAEAVADLRQRLANTRWPAEVTDSGWDLGTNLGYLRELCAYWQNGFDFEAQAAYLNRMPQFTTDWARLSPRRRLTPPPLPKA